MTSEFIHMATYVEIVQCRCQHVAIKTFLKIFFKCFVQPNGSYILDMLCTYVLDYIAAHPKWRIICVPMVCTVGYIWTLWKCTWKWNSLWLKRTIVKGSRSNNWTKKEVLRPTSH